MEDGHQDASVPSGERAQRLAKLAELRSRGVDPYPVRFDRDHNLGELREKFGDLPPGQETSEPVQVAGRLMLIRRQGGLTFAELRDRTGKIQLFVDTHVVGGDEHHSFDHLDRGDIIGVHGTVMTTRRGELSVKVERFQLLTKSLRPLPAKWEGLTDVDTRFRQRYVDLVVNEKARHIFDIRFKAIASIRDDLMKRGFLEVETPVLQTEQGGATARPFVTHHNTLDTNLYLRIALELHLKRLIVGGLERVFELGRVFRNEGMDTHHNPEFTMLEAYQAYGDYTEMMELTETLVVNAAKAARGSTVITLDGREIDLAKPWRRATMVDLIKEKAGVDIHPAMPVDDARRVLDGLGIHYQKDWGSGKLTNEVYDAKVEDELFEPTFVLDHPREVSPLARAHRSDPTLTERFEVVVHGTELANAYSELNDPIDQRQRFDAEAQAKAAGDPEAGDVDEDFLRALEYGMPPTGGMGMGIDRLVMLLAEVDSIREVILFPTLRPEGGRKGPPGPAPKEAMPAEHAAVVAAAAAAAEGHARKGDGDTEVATRGRGPGPERPFGAGNAGTVRAVAAMAAVGGLLSILPHLPLINSRIGDFGRSLEPVWFLAAGHVVSVVLGVVLLFLARQLAARKKTAWQVTVVLFAALAVTDVVPEFHPIAAVYYTVMVVVLVRYRQHFRAPANPPSLLRLLWFVPAYLGMVFAFGFGALLLARNEVEPNLTLGGMTTTVLKGLVGVHGAYQFESPVIARYFPAALFALGVVGLLVVALLAFRPIVERLEHTEDEWDHARRLVRAYGWDTLAYFALRDDKSFFFSADGEAMIAYTYMAGYALASGDPIGAPASIPLVIDEFQEFCRERAWNAAFLAVRESDLPLYKRRGFRHLYLGDEAIIQCDTFTLEGSAMKGIRQAVSRVDKQYRFELSRECDVRSELLDELNGISERWRGKKPERGFTMTLSQDLAGESTEFLICMAIDGDGKPGGFLRFVPTYGAAPGYTLDLMRHEPDSPNGMTEFLIAQSAIALKDRGVGRLSMNFAAWGRLFDTDIQYGPGLRMARWFVNLLNPFFQVKSLHDFNQKFSPEWLPRVICYERSADLAKVATLYAGVEGFLSLPGVGQLLVPKAAGGAPAPDAASAA